MNITVAGRKITVSDALRSYALEKVENATKVFDVDPLTAEVVLRVEKNPAIEKPAIAEITLRTRGRVIRVEEAESDMYAAIDIASDKVARQLRKYKTRVVDHRDRTKLAEMPLDPNKAPDVIAAEEEEEAIVRYKYVDLIPLTESEALLQTDLLGHDFFVFLDKESGLINVIYHRHGGGYGLIKPADAEVARPA